MSFTDYLRLNELKICKIVRENLPKDLRKTTNLIAVKDGVLYAWDFQDNCVLTLNVKAARSRDGDNVSHQILLPVNSVLFRPELLTVNDGGTLLLVAGPSGVLVLELPARYPPYGAFEQGKEKVYCRSHSLDERLLLYSDVVQVRQVKFHPASTKNNHVLVLTCDNAMRLYLLENEAAINLGVYQIGETPRGVFPGTKTSYLAAFGEVAVDFDFGQPQLNQNSTLEKKSSLKWPAYVLRGDGNVYSVDIPLETDSKATVRGPLLSNTLDDPAQEACSIICLNTTPEVFCISNSNGTIYHSLLLPQSENEYSRIKESNPRASTKELVCFESIELELGMSTSDEDSSYTCPVFLHKDESRSGRYYATHSAGIHSVTISCLKGLQGFISNSERNLEDVFVNDSKAEYLICTKTSTSEKNNPVVGFTLYYEPTSLIVLLGDGNLVTLAILTTEILPKIETLQIGEKTDTTSPLKKMLREPFDIYIEKILKRSSNQPILKLPEGQRSQRECNELLQRASQAFREYFENHTRAREELQKRIKALNMMKEFQVKELDKMNDEKQELQGKAENLAEKYEDIKDRQDVIMKRCEKLLILVSQKKAEPSEAEKGFLEALGKYKEKVEAYKLSIDKLRHKMNYQKVHMKNWKEQEEKKVSSLSEAQAHRIKVNLREMGDRITTMVKEVNEFKQRLNLK